MKAKSRVLTPLAEVVELNPRRFTDQPADADLVSFVPMRAVEEESGHLDGSGVRPWSEVKKGYTAFQDGDVIVAKITPCMENGKFAMASALHGGRAAGSTEFHVLRAKPPLLAKYLLHFVFTPEVRRGAKMNMKGAAGQLRVPVQFFEGLKIPVPSLDVQREVVSYLDEQLSRLDASVAALHRVQANLKRYRASVLKSACEGRLVPTEAELARQEGRNFETGEQLLQRILAKRTAQWASKGSGGEPAAPDQSHLPSLPDGWAWASTEQLCGFITKGTTPSADRLLLSGDVQFLKVYNLTDDGELNHTYKPAFVTRETHEGELARSMTSAGDVLMNIVGPPLGQVSVVPPALAEANINQAIARFRTVLPEMNKYLAQTLLTKDVLDRSLREAKTTVGQVNLTLQICREIAIPLPPLAEQHRIVAEADRRLSLIRVAEAQVAANLARAQRLRQSILQAAFSAPATAQPGATGLC